MNTKTDKFMKAAIDQAKTGYEEGGIPIGAVLVKDDEIVGIGHNRRVQYDDPVIHAEIDCLRNTGRIGSYKNTTLYSTLMPCYMCAGAVVQFGIPRVVAGESRNFAGAKEFLISKGIKVIDLDLDECSKMMKMFIEKNPDLWNEDIGKL